MKHFDEIYEIAADGYGIVTASQAREAGMTSGEMRRWCTDGKLVRRGHGVYKVARWVPTPLDPFAEAVALVGDGSFLWGESVLSMHGLALVDPRSVSVATPKRVRRKLPDWVKAVPAPKGASTTFYEGIPSQRVADAIKACEGSVMGERLAEAAKRARRGARHLRRIRGPDEGAAMEEAKRPNSRRNLDIAIDRLCASTGDEPGRVKRLLATAIVGQMLPDGAAKGGRA